MTKKETISHDKASFYMAFKYLNKERTFEMWDYIEKNKQFEKDVARYFHVIEVFDKYKRENPDKTDDEIKEVLKDEVNTYRELHIKLTKGVAK